jgi:hypothetical protein
MYKATLHRRLAGLPAAPAALLGALLGALTTGYVGSMSHAVASLKFLGIALETVDNSAGAAGDKSLLIAKAGSFVFKCASGFTPVIADLGKEVYANTDWEVQVLTAGLTNLYKVGTITAIETTSNGQTGVRVRIDNYCV